ncbi:hypothetical protein K474DRAFT_1668413 [Panus rudis PR-1116 ss-1]|nr:hypothetical protein K474DRAFT_1668413 [Panus rudis PR-1116 ss-1]
MVPVLPQNPQCLAWVWGCGITHHGWNLPILTLDWGSSSFRFCVLVVHGNYRMWEGEQGRTPISISRSPLIPDVGYTSQTSRGPSLFRFPSFFSFCWFNRLQFSLIITVPRSGPDSDGSRHRAPVASHTNRVLSRSFIFHVGRASYNLQPLALLSSATYYRGRRGDSSIY